MRDIFIFTAMASLIPFILLRPQVGVLAWVWISVMNPHRLSFGWLYELQFLDLIVGLTLISMAINYKQLRMPKAHPIVVLIGIYFLWTSLTTIFAVAPEIAFDKWLIFAKTILLVFAILLTMHTRTQILALAAILVLSAAYFGVKGGVFTIVSGGGSRVWGPPSTAWGSNNGLSLVMLMTAPLMLAFRRFMTKQWMLWALYLAVASVFLAALGTQSRGGLLAFAAVLIFMTIRSRYKLRIFVLIIFAGISTYLFMPQSWHDRMATIVAFEEDQSANTRLVQWQYAVKITHERPFFANGFNAFYDRDYQRMFLADEIEANQNRAAHSVYFEVLGEQGYPGIVLFLILGYLAIRYSHKLGRHLQLVPATRDFGDMLYFMQFSFVAFAVNGITLNQAHLDIYWFYLALLYVILRQLGDTVGDVDEFIRQSAKPPKFGITRPLAATKGSAEQPG